jgi:hypothetical protein
MDGTVGHYSKRAEYSGSVTTELRFNTWRSKALVNIKFYYLLKKMTFTTLKAC